MTIDDKELALAREHPRGTERRRLLPYRAALNDIAAYAALPVEDRDAIVRWAEIRRRLKHEGIDRDPANLADALLSADDLRAHVLRGERHAASASPSEVDSDADLVALVASIRGKP